MYDTLPNANPKARSAISVQIPHYNISITTNYYKTLNFSQVYVTQKKVNTHSNKHMQFSAVLSELCFSGVRSRTIQRNAKLKDEITYSSAVNILGCYNQP